MSTSEGVQDLGQAWVVRGNDNQFPTGQAGHLTTLPDEWSKTQPGYQGAIWYRFHFDAKALPAPDQHVRVAGRRAEAQDALRLPL